MQFQSDFQTLPSHKAAAREIIATTTKQDALFPVGRMFCGSNEERHLQLERQLFSITDDFLYACITYGDGLENKPFSGFTRVKGLGYAFLAFFAQRAFGIHRFPFFSDRNLCDYLTDKQKKTVIDVIQMLSPERVNAICDELLDIHQHAQNLLKEKGIGEVHLTRKIIDRGDCATSRENYAQTIMTLKKAAQAVGVDKVQFEMDVLNSWGDDSGYSFYPILLRQRLPAQDILYFSNMIASRDASAGDHRIAVEEAEWVVVNRSPTGVVDFHVDDIVFDESVYEDSRNWSRERYAKFLENYSPFPFRYAHRIDERHASPGFGWRLTRKGRLGYLLKALSPWN
ncbi:hypothetical protein [Mesorhizobium sp. L48C026A00]|uniref:hypothetical protein n=1 Tax=Mesorhizobium sp. L48C026A00 TaxID=1287182 RepID=UPI0003CFB9A8|nr:hypothetical protein [Mesorhizobium sp. L48C026A00]ESZ03712.1 hypothetical protein X737_37365 [Mesorhizobium sp. L48C026A00]